MNTVSKELALANAVKAREKAWRIRKSGEEGAEDVAEAYDREAKGWEEYVASIDRDYRNAMRDMADMDS